MKKTYKVDENKGFFRVFRGGSCSTDVRRCRAADRSRFRPSFIIMELGFRLFMKGFINASESSR